LLSWILIVFLKYLFIVNFVFALSGNKVGADSFNDHVFILYLFLLATADGTLQGKSRAERLIDFYCLKDNDILG